MSSGDTDATTRELLEMNNNLGVSLHDHVPIVCQDKVAASRSGNAGLALNEDDRWTVQRTKSHGHGHPQC